MEAANAVFRCHLESLLLLGSGESPWRHLPPVISPLLSPLGWLTHCSHHFFTASLALTTSTSTILIPLTHTLCVSLYQQLLEITSCLPPRRRRGLHWLQLGSESNTSGCVSRWGIAQTMRTEENPSWSSDGQLDRSRSRNHLSRFLHLEMMKQFYLTWLPPIEAPVKGGQGWKGEELAGWGDVLLPSSSPPLSAHLSGNGWRPD